MRIHSFLKAVVLLVILALALGALVQKVNAALTLKGVQTWYWANNANVTSVAIGNVDGDGATEIVTGGHYWDGTRDVAQLCVWNGATLALENVQIWHGTSHTYIYSVAVGNVDGDGATEIVTGGYYSDGSGYYAQLCVWSGATLALENVRTWRWESNSGIVSVAIGNVDGDGATEIVTGGTYNDAHRSVAQLCVWDGATLALENFQNWLWGSTTYLESVAIGNVDGDGATEIVTGGYYDDGTRLVAQLCVWNGGSLALENVQTWYWIGTTYVYSVAVGNVDGDGATEIVTGGRHDNGARLVAQLCVWA